jgi:hypothetical protein
LSAKKGKNLKEGPQAPPIVLFLTRIFWGFGGLEFNPTVELFLLPVRAFPRLTFGFLRAAVVPSFAGLCPSLYILAF